MHKIVIRMGKKMAQLLISWQRWHVVFWSKDLLCINMFNLLYAQSFQKVINLFSSIQLLIWKSETTISFKVVFLGLYTLIPTTGRAVELHIMSSIDLNKVPFSRIFTLQNSQNSHRTMREENMKYHRSAV